MFSYDVGADAQAQPGALAVGLSGKEGVEDLFPQVFRHPTAVVRDGEQDRLVILQRQFQVDLAVGSADQTVQGVVKQVNDCLREGVGISIHADVGRFDRAIEMDLLLTGPGVEEFYRLEYHICHPDRLPLGWRTPAKGQYSLY